MNVSATFSIPASVVTSAQAVADGLQGGHQGMFRSFTKAGGQMGGEGDTPVLYCSSGVLDSDSPLLGTKADLETALAETDVTQADIDAFYDNCDIELPGTGKRRLADLDAYITSMEAQGFTVTWRDFGDDFGDDFA